MEATSPLHLPHPAKWAGQAVGAPSPWRCPESASDSEIIEGRSSSRCAVIAATTPRRSALPTSVSSRTTPRSVTGDRPGDAGDEPGVLQGSRTAGGRRCGTGRSAREPRRSAADRADRARTGSTAHADLQDGVGRADRRWSGSACRSRPRSAGTRRGRHPCSAAARPAPRPSHCACWSAVVALNLTAAIEASRSVLSSARISSQVSIARRPRSEISTETARRSSGLLPRCLTRNPARSMRPSTLVAIEVVPPSSSAMVVGRISPKRSSDTRTASSGMSRSSTPPEPSGASRIERSKATIR